jgi:hypothetical protein
MFIMLRFWSVTCLLRQLWWYISIYLRTSLSKY